VTDAATVPAAVRWPLPALFAALSAFTGSDPQAGSLDEEAIARVVERARSGDTAARQMLYLQYVDRVYRTVRGMLRSDADAEDVTQDAMLTVLTSLHAYRPRADARFAAWVTTFAANTARRRFRRRRPETTATGELPEVAGEPPDPLADLERARQRRALLTALAELSAREREAVSLRYGGDLNATEIAACLGLAPAAVRKILERARTRLGARLESLLGLEEER
jgi:RNA polymerase sigma-70 factor (ECF subfamily)